jgi:CHAT domain-containing protein
MTKNMPAPGTAALALWAGLYLGGLAAPAPAVPPEARALQSTLRQADDHYRAGRLPQAEELYRRALTRVAGEKRRHCSERLLLIYAQAGRQDRAIAVALPYERWLRRAGDRSRARDLALQVGGWYLDLGHYALAERHLRRGLADLEDDPLPPAQRATALAQVGVAAQRQGDRARAARTWQEVEKLTQKQLALPARELGLRQRIACARALAGCYRFRGETAKIVSLLEGLLPAYDRLADPDGKRDTLRLLAGHLAAAGQFARAQKHLREALHLQQRHHPSDRLTRADLACELAEVLERQEGQAGAAARVRQGASADYEVIWKESRSRAGALAVFWRVQGLYQRSSRYRQALTLTESVLGEWVGALLEPRFKVERGRLKAIMDRDREPARRLLRAAVEDLEGQSPANLVELPRALLTLGAVELAGGTRAEAERLGKRALKLYEEHRLPEDLVLVEAYNLLGTCTAQGGDYAAGLDLYRKGVALCGRLGPAADLQHCGLRLNMALLLKAQGDLDGALTECRQARAVYRRFAGPDSPGLAAFDAARAALLAVQVKIEEANALAGRVLRLCARHELPDRSLLKCTARHCQALHHLWRRDFARAEEAWQEVAELHGQKSPLWPRTLNYLALSRECQGDNAGAEGLYRQARRLQQADPRAFPATYFTTLWRLAELADRRGDRAEARALLEQAVTVVEQARLRTYGDARQRAAFFAQFAPAFERLVEWGARAGDVEAAVCAAARGRSRTLMDQLLLAAVAPRPAAGEDRRGLLRRAESLKRQVAALRARAQFDPDRAREVLKEIDRTQQEYAEVYREVLSASPVYRSLAQPTFTRQELAGLRSRIVGAKRLLLVYHVGRRRSYLLLLDGHSDAAAFPLSVPAEVAQRIAPPQALVRGEGGPRTRGLVLRAPQEQPELPRQRRGGALVPLGQAVLRDLVDNYLDQVANRNFRASRGIRLQESDAAGRLPAQRPELLADVLLPPEARQRIRAAAPECVLIIPDGALHKLPFEALLVQAGARPRYVLDELPPLVYAPSVAALALLAGRPAAPDGPLSLLTVADPAYPRRRAGAPDAARAALWLPRLEGTAKESARISRLFKGEPVRVLRGAAATKRAVVAALPGRRVVHLAAHGIADERFGNLFGGLALTPSPPGKGGPADDGLLPMHEIYALPLKDCELAVLSACDTNVGPQQPLEAGVTLAGGFLSAGARRVVASHWAVADDPTAELMEVFFTEALTARKRGAALPFARALQEARRKVRHKRPEPFYWAPFVLIGPAG